LKRGYTITYLNDQVIKPDTEISEGDELNTKLYSKSIRSKVLKINNE
jgi:ribosomal 50S subunit-recycling heat shock protein